MRTSAGRTSSRTRREGRSTSAAGRCPAPRRTFTDSVSFDRLRLNHYLTRSEREYADKLRTVWPGIEERAEQNPAQIARTLHALDEVEDRSIQMHLPDLKRALADLAYLTVSGPSMPAWR